MENPNNQNIPTDGEQTVTTNTSDKFVKLKEFCKKPWILISAAVVIIAIIVTAIILSQNQESDKKSKRRSSDYKLEIVNTWQGYDMSSGKYIFIATYKFTNNSDEPISFMGAFDDNAYQNGAALSRTYYNYGVDGINYFTEVLNGTTVDIPITYICEDVSAPIQIVVKERGNKRGVNISETFENKWSSTFE